MKRLTVGEIVSLFLYKERDIQYSSFLPSYELTEGKRIHNRLGFDQPWLFRKYFWTGKDWWLVIGCPDKLDQKAGLIHELKTFGERNISKNMLLGATIQCQLYCWLTGLPRFIIWGHSVYSNKTSKRLEGKYDPVFVENVLREAVELKLSLADFARVYREKKEAILETIFNKKEGENEQTDS